MGWLPAKKSNNVIDMVSLWKMQSGWEVKDLLSHRRFRIWAGTFNLDHRTPDDSIKTWLRTTPEGESVGWDAPDVYFIGAQESIFPGGHRRWFSKVQAAIKDIFPNEEFFIVARVCMLSQNLLLLARKAFEKHIHTVSYDTEEFLWGRGGIAASFFIGDTSIGFVTSQLQPGAVNYRERNQQYGKLTSNLRLGEYKLPILAQFDHVIWVGDLGYQVEGLTWSEMINKSVDKDLYKRFRYGRDKAFDQLSKAVKSKEGFWGFEEAENGPSFAPTFPLQRGKPVNATTKLRPRVSQGKAHGLPSWTDRVITYTQESVRKRDLTPFVYRSTPEVTTSDHTPVSALYNLEVPDVVRKVGSEDTKILVKDITAIVPTEHADKPLKVQFHCIFCTKPQYVLVTGKDKQVSLTLTTWPGYKARHLLWKYMYITVTPRHWYGDGTRHMMYGKAHLRTQTDIKTGFIQRMWDQRFRTVHIWRDGAVVGKLRFKVSVESQNKYLSRSSESNSSFSS